MRGEGGGAGGGVGGIVEKLVERASDIEGFYSKKATNDGLF